MTTISKGENIVDSRDIIARINELTELRDDLAQQAKDARERIAELEAADPGSTELGELLEQASDIWMAEDGTELAYSPDFGEDEYDELKELVSLAEQGEGCGDWEHGATLIRDDYFQTYAEQLAEDLGYISRDVRWPYTCIDWEQAADELRQDYSVVEWGDISYLIRS